MGPRHHVVIAGTGRAGTSFLVRFLGDCGVDVGPTDDWADRARAGLEHNIFDTDAPYVVKDPWLFTYCDTITPDQITVDALIVPVRDLMAAATSRILQERITHADTAPQQRPFTELRGGTLGGAIYSLDPVDQARILAVGFHQLIHWAIAHEIPLFLLDFPRMIDDEQHLLDTLWPWLGTHCTRDQAHTAFTATADRTAIRIPPEPVPDPAAPVMTSSTRDQARAARLDRDAMATLLAERDTTIASLQNLAGRLTETENRLGDLRGQLSDSERRLDLAETGLHAARHENAALKNTLSWRITRPLRAARAASARRTTP